MDMGVNPSLVGMGMAVEVGGTVIEAGGTAVAVAVGAGFMVQLQPVSQMLLIDALPSLHVLNDGTSIKLKNPMFISGFPLLSVNNAGLSM